MKRAALFLAYVLAILGTLAAAPPRLAVGDFTVTSDNPRLKYIGKGLAEMIAADLASARGVTLIDRDKRDAALGEMEFSLSGMADAETQVEAGKLLAADYLLFGEIIDMDTTVLVACRLIKVQTAEVAWSDKKLGKLADYDGISRALAASALRGLGVEGAAVAAAAPPKAAVSEEKKLQAIVAFSGAVDALDRKDTEGARRQIAVAKAIDPGNAAVTTYAAKLAGGSPRFLVELDKYAPTYNPALLGFIGVASIYTWASSTQLVGDDVGQYNIVKIPNPSPAGDLKYKEAVTSIRAGALLPLGENLGVMAEFKVSSQNNYTGFATPGSQFVQQTLNSEINLDQEVVGATIGVGALVAPGLSVGLSGDLQYQVRGRAETVSTWYDIYPEAAGIFFGAAGGLAYRSPTGVWSADIELVWSSQPEFYVLGPPSGSIAPGNIGSFEKSTVPLIASLGLTRGFLNQTVFANIRSIGEIGLDDRGYLAIREIPGLEWWPYRWLAIRAGYEYSLVKVERGAISREPASASGSGFMGGITLSRWGCDLNLNYVNRYRPFRLVPGSGHQDQAILLGISYSGLVSRR